VDNMDQVLEIALERPISGLSETAAEVLPAAVTPPPAADQDRITQ